MAVRRLDLFGTGTGDAKVTKPAAAPPRWAFRKAPPQNVASRPSADAPPPDEDDSGPAAPPPVDVPADSYAGRLLAARKKARDKLDDR